MLIKNIAKYSRQMMGKLIGFNLPEKKSLIRSAWVSKDSELFAPGKILLMNTYKIMAVARLASSGSRLREALIASVREKNNSTIG